MARDDERRSPRFSDGTILAYEHSSASNARLARVDLQSRVGAHVASRKGNRGGSVELADARIVSRNAKLTITNSIFAGLEVVLKKRRITLGKNIGCDICLDDSLVSEEHASITKTDAGYVIEDLNSRNGITLNGKETHQRKLRKGDTIEIGNFRLKFSC